VSFGQTRNGFAAVLYRWRMTHIIYPLCVDVAKIVIVFYVIVDHVPCRDIGIDDDDRLHFLTLL